MLDVGQLCFKVIFPDQRRSFIINFTKLVLSFCTKTLKLKPFSGSVLGAQGSSISAGIGSQRDDHDERTGDRYQFQSCWDLGPFSNPMLTRL